MPVKIDFTPETKIDFTPDAPHRPTPEEVRAHFANFGPLQTHRLRSLAEGAASVGIQPPQTLGEWATELLTGPVGVLAKRGLEGQIEQGRQALKPGRPGVERAGHALAATLPLVGPAAAQFGETLVEDPWKAAGQAGGLALT